MVLRLLAEEGGQMQSQERRRPLGVHGGVGGEWRPTDFVRISVCWRRTGDASDMTAYE